MDSAKNIVITKDGDSWCARIGEDLQLGEVGFGADPISALINLRTKLPSETIEVSPELLTALLNLPTERGQLSDGYHSFNDLYSHRHLLFAMAARLGNWGNNDRKLKGWKAWKHHDGTFYEGWFIAGLELPTGTITYHFPAEYWTLIGLPHIDRAPEWDGHTSDDVLQRITDWLKSA